MAQRGTLPSHAERGNVLIFILLAIALGGIVTAVIMQGTQNVNQDIDSETLSVQISSVQQYATELQNGVRLAMQNGISEDDLRFAHPDAPPAYGLITDNPEAQIFERFGGGVSYRLPPEDIQETPGPWEFYGGTALPNVGTDRAELIAVLPNVTEDFCEAMNRRLGYTGQPSDTAACLFSAATGRYGDGTPPFFANSPNTVDAGSFSQSPALSACVMCGVNYHYYHVLMVR